MPRTRTQQQFGEGHLTPAGNDRQALVECLLVEFADRLECRLVAGVDLLKVRTSATTYFSNSSASE
jgi:hypothetical protein